MEEDRLKIKELGFKIQCSSWDRENLSRTCIQYQPMPLLDDGIQWENVVNEQDVWQVFTSFKSLKVEIVHAYRAEGTGLFFFGMDKSVESKPMMKFERLFYGTILTQDQLRKVMDQVGCTYHYCEKIGKCDIDN